MKNHSLKIIFFLAFLAYVPSQAYYAVLDNGTLIDPGSFRLTASPQFLLSGDVGANISGRFDYGINESSSARVKLGFGRVSFFTGGSYKWIPIPDYNNQPALGGIVGFTFASFRSVSEFAIHLQPLVSKKFDSELGLFTPYASVPFSFSNSSTMNSYPVQMVFGTEFKPQSLKYISFMTELGFDISESFSFLSFAALITFDRENGLSFE